MPTATPPPTSTAPEPARERPPTETSRPQGEAAPPSETALLVAELNRAGQAATDDQIAHVFAALLLAHSRQLADSNLDDDIKSVSDEPTRNRLEALRAELGQRGLEFFDAEGKPTWITGFEAASKPYEAESRTLAAINSLLVRHQVGAKLLRALVPGGIQFLPVNPHAPKVPNIDEVAHFFPPDARVGTGARIVVYESLFKPQLVPAKAIYHELAHALLLADGAVYELANFRSGAAPASTDANVTYPAPPLDPSEKSALFGALTNPDYHRPWETPYVAQLLDRLASDQNPKFKKHILEEMLAERLRLFLESDGSLGDFIKKRLLNATLVQERASQTSAGNTSEVSRATSRDSSEVKEAQPLSDFAQNLDVLLGELSGTPGTNRSYLEMLDRLIDTQVARNQLPVTLGQPLKDFLRESYHLHARFSRLIGPENQAALLKTLESRAINLETYPFDHDWDAAEPNTFALRPAAAVTKGKTFWQWLADAFGQLLNLFNV